MNTIKLQSVPQGEFVEISIENPKLNPPLEVGSKPLGWGESIVNLILQRKALKYDVHNMPTLPENVKEALDKTGYVHAVFDDEHFLIPKTV